MWERTNEHIEQQRKYENSNYVKREIKCVLEFEIKDIVIETKNMVLFQVTDKHQLWVPIKDLWKNKIKFTHIKLFAYKGSNKKYRLVSGKNESYNDITLEELVNQIIKNPEMFEKYVKIIENRN